MSELKIVHVLPDDRWEVRTSSGEEPLMSFDREEQAKRFLQTVQGRQKQRASRGEESSDEDNW